MFSQDNLGIADFLIAFVSDISHSIALNKNKTVRSTIFCYFFVNLSPSKFVFVRDRINILTIVNRIFQTEKKTKEYHRKELVL